MGYFKTKKKRKYYILYLVLFLVSIAFSIKYLYRENLINSNTIIATILGDSTDSNNITDVDFILKYVLNIGLDEHDEEVIDKEVFEEELSLTPIVYIYNTHQTEKYQSGYLKSYNIDVTVLTASYILKEYLEDEGIGVIVEDSSVSSVLSQNNWKYASSYKVSRMFLDNAVTEYPTLTYFIDLHRDSSSYSATTTEIAGESYARILFIIGLENENYEENLALAETLKEKINNVDESLFRGIMKKSGAGVNGVYNQDFSSNAILIEVGGQYNYIDEVNNTLKVLATIISEYIKEDTYGI